MSAGIFIVYGFTSKPKYAAIMTTSLTATNIQYAKKSRKLTVHFNDGFETTISAELLRVYSPSAEVRGHGATDMILVRHKSSVGIKAIHPVGNYAIQITFDDGHNTGIYSWEFLQELGKNQEQLYAEYRERCIQADSKEALKIPIQTRFS